MDAATQVTGISIDKLGDSAAMFAFRLTCGQEKETSADSTVPEARHHLGMSKLVNTAAIPGLGEGLFSLRNARPETNGPSRLSRPRKRFHGTECG